MKKNILHLFVTFILFVSVFNVFSCKKAAVRQTATSKIVWHKYSYSDYNGYLYITQNNDRMNAVLCANVFGIQGCIKLNHSCSESQFMTVQKKLSENGASVLGTVEEPDTKGYPDLSRYMGLVISDTELHHLWKELGLE